MEFTIDVLLYYYSSSTTATMSALSMRRPTGFHAPRHGRAHLQPVPKNRSRRAFFWCDEVFFRSEIQSAYQLKVRTAIHVMLLLQFLEYGKGLDERLCALILRLR